jgi:hypothetical protein
MVYTEVFDKQKARPTQSHPREGEISGRKKTTSFVKPTIISITTKIQVP